MNEKLINYKRLDELVKQYESIFLEKEKLDIDEEKLLLDVLKDRNVQKLNKLRMADAVNNVPFGGLLKKITKGVQNE